MLRHGGIDGIQAGNLNEHYYYAGWRVIEERDNSANTLAQTVYGTEYIDAPVCRDRNTDVTAGGSPDDDCLDSGGSARYFYHQDANFRVVAMTDESAAVVERYDYDAYGEPRVYAGVSGSAESGALRMASAIGNPYLHQGLRWDNETGLHENRMRSLHSRLGRYMQRDPAGYMDGQSLYLYGHSSCFNFVDPLGLIPEISTSGLTAGAVGFVVRAQFWVSRAAAALAAGNPYLAQTLLNNAKAEIDTLLSLGLVTGPRAAQLWSQANNLFSGLQRAIDLFKSLNPTTISGLSKRASDFLSKALDALKDHLNTWDLRGALAQAATGVKQGGYNHLQEVRDALQSLKNLIDALNAQIGDLTVRGSNPALLKELQALVAKLTPYVNRLQSLLDAACRRD